MTNKDFSDGELKPMSPSRNPDYYDPMEVDIITNKMFGSVHQQDMIHLTKQSLRVVWSNETNRHSWTRHTRIT